MNSKGASLAEHFLRNYRGNLKISLQSSLLPCQTQPSTSSERLLILDNDFTPVSVLIRKQMCNNRLSCEATGCRRHYVSGSFVILYLPMISTYLLSCWVFHGASYGVCFWEPRFIWFSNFPVEQSLEHQFYKQGSAIKE